MRACSAFTVLVVALPLIGCGKPNSATNAPAPSNAPTPSSGTAAPEPEPTTPVPIPETMEVEKNFKLGDYLPPLDDGRIEIAPPADWNVMPRDSKFLTRFYKESRNSLPRIEITVEDQNLGGLTNVTKSNVADFTAAVAKDLEARGTAVLEEPIPMLIGSVPCARYVSHLKLKIGEGTLLIERQTLELLHAGRLYKINLLVEIEKVTESRDAAYAVCSGVRFPTGESAPTE